MTAARKAFDLSAPVLLRKGVRRGISDTPACPCCGGAMELHGKSSLDDGFGEELVTNIGFRCGTCHSVVRRSRRRMGPQNHEHSASFRETLQESGYGEALRLSRMGRRSFVARTGR